MSSLVIFNIILAGLGTLFLIGTISMIVRYGQLERQYGRRFANASLEGWNPDVLFKLGFLSIIILIIEGLYFWLF